MPKKLLVAYLAGPIHSAGRAADRIRNFADAVSTYAHLLKAGAAVVCPQVTMLVAWPMEEIDYETWMAHGLELVSRSDLVVRLPGISPGADRECQSARELGIPVVTGADWLSCCRAAETRIDRHKKEQNFEYESLKH